MSLTSDLNALRAFLTPREKWTQGHSARLEDGHCINALHPNAVCWCLFGATVKIETDYRVDRLLDQLVQPEYPTYVNFNDNVSTTHEMVLDLIDRAIVVANLMDARDLISDPARWTQETAARNIDGMPVEEIDPSAVCWCTTGAIVKVNPKDHLALYRPVMNALRETNSLVIDTNDGYVPYKGLRGHPAVMAMFDDTIARLTNVKTN